MNDNNNTDWLLIAAIVIVLLITLGFYSYSELTKTEPAAIPEHNHNAEIVTYYCVLADDNRYHCNRSPYDYLKYNSEREPAAPDNTFRVKASGCSNRFRMSGYSNGE